MGQITKNIWTHELTCKCGNCDVTILPDETVIQLVQDACDHLARINGVDKVILEITSAARCYVYNREIGSNDNSQHPRARAIDHKIFFPSGKQIPPSEVYDYYARFEMYEIFLGIGKYNTFTHLDTRPVNARWDKTEG